MRVLYAFLIFICILFLLLPVAVPLIKTSAEFSIFNTNWNGCSKLARLLAERGEIVPLLNPYNSVGLERLDGVLIVIGPNLDFSSLEAEEVKKFLENGGTLFIADDFGTANGLLEKLGMKTRFSGQPLNDIFYNRKADFPVVVRIEEDFVVKEITLNVPSVIVGAEGEILSSKVSIVGKSMKSYPILAELEYGEGRIVLLSDPSVLINDMFDENKEFIENLFLYLGSSKFYLDEAHRSDFNPYAITSIYIHRELDRERAFQVFLVVSALAILIESRAYMIAFRMLQTLAKPRRERAFDELPEWVDPKIIERIVGEIKAGSKLGGSYGRKQERIHR
jgi:hypothetical protein